MDLTSGRQAAANAGPVGYALAQATKAHRTELQRRMAQLGLHLGQELLVVDLHLNPNTTQAELVARIGMEQPTIAKAITRMERTGFVERAQDPSDRRVIRLHLTARGEDVVQDILAAWADIDSQAVSGLSMDEITQLTELLNKLQHNFA